ncbi:MAG: S1C family serine protease [Zavarzinella sp.]
MIMIKLLKIPTLLLCCLFPAIASGQVQPIEKVVSQTNEKVVKLFGAGGFRGAESYGTGIIVSPQGHILTAASTFLDGRLLRLHLPDGRKFMFKVLDVEPEFDAAVLQIVQDEKTATKLDLPYFDIAAEIKKVPGEAGDSVLAFTNCYSLATRDEMVSVQQGTITAVGKLSARRGAFEVPFNGDVYYLDAITNNPGAAGGPLINRKGDLLGFVGKEYRNVQTETWVNYAVPLQTEADLIVKGEKTKATLQEYVSRVIAGTWKSPDKRPAGTASGPGPYTGIVFVPRVVERTPPYIERILADSPAAKVGLKADDLIVYLEGEPVYSLDVFQDLIKRYQPGDKVQIEIRRGDKLTALSLELAPQPQK